MNENDVAIVPLAMLTIIIIIQIMMIIIITIKIIMMLMEKLQNLAGIVFAPLPTPCKAPPWGWYFT